MNEQPPLPNVEKLVPHPPSALSQPHKSATPDARQLPSSPIPTPPSEPSPRAIAQWLPIYLAKSDDAITRLNKILLTTSGTDTTLLLLSYTLTLITSPTLSLLSSSSSSPTSPRHILPAKLLTRLTTLTGLISDHRIFIRLLALPSLYAWARSAIQQPERDPTIRALVAAQIAVNVFYQVLENVAYLASKGVLVLRKGREERLWLWSGRFWMGHVALDLVRLWRVREIRREAARVEAEETGDETGGKIKKGDGVEEGWRRELAVNLAYAPLTVHWSLEKGLWGVSDGVVGGLGMVAGILGMQKQWRAAGTGS